MNLDLGKIFAIIDYLTKLIQKYTTLLFGNKSEDENTDQQITVELDYPAQDSPSA